MENRQRWVTISYIGLGVLFGYIVQQILLKVMASTDIESKLANADLWILGLAIGSGLALFLGLFWNDRINQYMNEVVVELSRVTWPNPEETLKINYRVIAAIAFAGVVLGLMDFVWTKTVQGLFVVMPDVLGWMR